MVGGGGAPLNITRYQWHPSLHDVYNKKDFSRVSMAAMSCPMLPGILESQVNLSQVIQEDPICFLHERHHKQIHKGKRCSLL